MPLYTRDSTIQVNSFMKGLTETAVKPTGTFDSAAADSFVKESLSQNSAKIPETLKGVLDSVDNKEAGRIMRAVFDGANKYKAAHGQEIPADVMEQAFHSAYSTTPDGQKAVLDSVGTSLQSVPSYQANRAIVAILATTTEAIPFVHYLPADIGSNQAKLAILQHTAGTTTGAYADGEIIDGAGSGGRYISSAREHVLTHGEAGALTGKITTVQDTDETCDQNAPAAKLVRGSLIIYANGLKCAEEMRNSTSYTNSAVAGTVTIAGVTYSISGSVNTDTGAIALTSTPALPAEVKVLAEGFIDYERQPNLTPSIITTAATFDLWANAWRTNTTTSIVVARKCQMN